MKILLLAILSLLLLLPLAQPVLGAVIQTDELAPITHWRVGFLLNTPPTTAKLANLPASAAVRLTSSLPSADYYWVLPLSTLVQVEQVRLLLYDRNGFYTQDFLASVEVFSLSAGYQRTLSTSDFNLKTAANNSWRTIPLSGNLVLKSDEVLVIHFKRVGTSGGDLSLNIGLDVLVNNLTVHLPVISR